MPDIIPTDEQISADYLRVVLARAIPEARAAAWAGPTADALHAWGVRPARWPWLLANILHESAGMTRLVESLRYTPDRLMAVWPTRFPTRDVAERYADDPRALAEHVYSGRLGNGPEGSGDGWRYRGRGLIMLTGRANYQAYADASGQPVVDQPSLLQQPSVAADAAAWFWWRAGLDAAPTFPDAVRRINGGLTGLADRERYLQRLTTAGAPYDAPPAASGPLPTAPLTPDRLGEHRLLVMHDFHFLDAILIGLSTLRGRPAIIRAPVLATRTPREDGTVKLDVRKGASDDE